MLTIKACRKATAHGNDVRPWSGVHVCSLLLALLVCLSLPPVQAEAAAAYNVGFRTLGLWPAVDGNGLDVNVWYPSTSSHRPFVYPPWEITAARDGHPVRKGFPLLLLSHDSPANRFSYHDTAAWLASIGFIVAAPTHAADCMDNMANLFSGDQLADRVEELRITIDLLLTHADTRGSVDPQRIAVLGYGAGGAAALLLGGALPNCENWIDYCTTATPGDDYCNEWAKERVSAMCTSFPLTRSLADPRVKAVVAVAPAFGMFFSRESFAYYYPPTLVVGADGDGMDPTARNAEALADMIEEGVEYTMLTGADLGAFQAACPDALAQELPELCKSVDERERRRIHDTLNLAMNEFFLLHLGSSDRLPYIPDPPDLSSSPATLQDERSASSTFRRSRMPRGR